MCADGSLSRRAAGHINPLVHACVVQALLAATHAAQAATPRLPNLPTPCLGTPCGTQAGNIPFVTSGKASAVAAGQTLTVTQQTNSAILNWRDFNIAPGYTVNFQQPSTTAAALNRIWSGNPSVIAGQLHANGQIYLINTSGIIFAKTAQVNTGTLVASTLDIADVTFLKGLLSGNTQQYTGAGVLPPVFQADPGTPPAGVSVAPGAQLAASDGGRIMLLGATVSNGGKITAPDGQVILGGGTTVYLTSTTDPSLRGLLIAVDAQEVAANGTVTNTGQISAPRGNVTLAGLVVNQAGTVSATTSVNANGSVYLVAGDADTNAFPSFYNPAAVGFAQGQLLPTVGGTLTLASGSVTEVQPDSTSTTTITSAQTFYPSQVELVGKNITLAKQSAVVAPGAQVDAVAFANPYQGVAQASAHTLPPQSDGARIYIDAGSTIDVSGLTNVSAPSNQNLVQIELGANELQDDPLLRNGFLHGQTVTVDITRGTPLLNAATLASYASTIGRTIDEKLSAAGTINLTSGGDVITRAGSTLNVSGGSIAFQTSAGATSKLTGADGKVYDIGSAPNTIEYVGIANTYSYTDPRWGTQTNFAAAGTWAGYLEGSAAGAVSVRAPGMFLGGALLAHTTAGPYQRTSATLPAGGLLSLGDPAAAPDPATGLRNLDAPALTLLNSVTDTLGSFDPLTSTLPQPTEAELGVVELAQNGFNRISIASNGAVTLPATTHLTLTGASSVTLEGASADLAGTIRAPGGNVSVRTDIALAGETATNASNLLIATGAAIDVSGNWVNDTPLFNPQLPTAPTLYNGGSVSLAAAQQNNVILAAGSRIDVSGGAWANHANVLTPGAAGTITLKGGGPLQLGLATGGVVLDGTLRGASLTDGGTLSISTAWVSVGTPSQGRPGELSFAPSFFTQGGFGTYNITGVDGVTIGSAKANQGVTLAPLEQTLLFSRPYQQDPSADNLVGLSTLTTLPQEYRQPASVAFSSTLSSFGAPGAGDLLFNAGSSIVTDPGATVSLAARQNLTVAGNITAPAGTINLQVAPGVTAASASDIDGYIPDQALLITSAARLSAEGFAAVYTNQNPLGFRQGQVLSGGSINVVANKGSVIAQTGAVLDVSGTSAVADVPLQNRSVVPTTVAGNAGAITIEALEGLVVNSTLLGRPVPVAGAAGGTLTVGLDKFNLQAALGFNSTATVPLYPTNDRNLTVTARNHLPDTLPVDGSGNIIDGLGTVSAATLTSGGFDNIHLSSSDLITLDGNVTLTARASLTLNALQLQATSGTRAQISAPYIELGSSVYYPSGVGESGRNYVPLSGDGTLNVSANLIDVIGNSSVSGFQLVALNSSGDLRFGYGVDVNDLTDFTGSLKSPADLTLRAAQIYPVTAAHFTINPADIGSDPTQAASYDYTPGGATVYPGAASSTLPPLSAQGSLTIDSPAINQYGVLRAPFGEIGFNGVGAQSLVALHAGSVTSVSGAGAVIPYGSTQNATNWTYQQNNPTGTAPVTTRVSTLAPKQISTNGADVVIDSGAKVDLSGGGDLYAYEFIAGTGGSRDVLTPGNGYSYAILPSLGSAFAPIDHQYGAGTNIPVGQEIYLSGIPGLPSGYYALLPPRYALLPGAFAVQLMQRNSDIAPGSAVQQPGSGYLTAGRFAQAGTSLLDSRTSTFLVTPETIVRTQSQYTDSYANVFFNSAAQAAGAAPVNLPADAGQLTLGATQALRLNAPIDFAPGQFVAGKDPNGKDIIQTGAGGIAAIVAAQIEVVEPGATPDGSLQLAAASLNGLGASTLILGGSRAAGATGDTLTVGASTVTIRNSAADPLSAPEILLAATQAVTVAPGAAIAATGTSSSASPAATGATSGVLPQLDVSGDGALLRLATGTQVELVRSHIPSGAVGQLSVGSGATLTGNSLILDAASSTQIAADAAVTAHSVEASSSRISVGDVPQGTAGLDLTPSLLGSFTGLTDLSLRSSTTIDFYGAVSLGGAAGTPVLNSITLDATGIGGYGSGTKRLDAGSITLTNSAGLTGPASFLSAPSGSGQLMLAAQPQKATPAQIILGPGSEDVEGFGGVLFTAPGGDLRSSGIGALTLTNGGNLSVQAARISGDAQASQTLTNASGAVTIAAATLAGSPALEDPGLGGRLVISATSGAGTSAISLGAPVDLPSGSVLLEAKGGGDLSLASGGVISVAGVAKPFYDTYAVSPAGSVQLISDGGSVVLNAGSTVNVAGVTAADGKTSGAAGSLTLAAPQGQVVIAGTLEGGAGNGMPGGSFTLDTGGNASHAQPFLVSQLNLGTAGFSGDIDIRDRGDANVIVDGLVKSHSFLLSADQGAISVTGTVDTSGALGSGGGDISMWSANGLTVQSGALLNAAAGAANGSTSGRGGTITLGTTSGLVTLAAGATLDITGSAGNDNPGVNPDGRVILSGPYNSATGTLGVSPIAATIRASAPPTVIVDAAWTYSNVSVLGSAGDLTPTTLANDVMAFESHAPSLAAGLVPPGSAFNVQLRPAVTVSGSGDLTLGDTLDLNGLAAAASNGTPIDLTLRAPGNLLLEGSLSDGFSGSGNLTSWALAGGDSAFLRLTAGADLSGANPLATVRGSGNLILTSGNLVRTGNGNIALAAGNEICLGCLTDGTVDSSPQAQESVVYTAGVPSSNAPAYLTPPVIKPAFAPPQWPVDGGSISVTAGGDIVSAPTSDLVSNWLWRQGIVTTNGTVTRDPSWWIESNAFQQGIGVLGGGNLTVRAGGDIVNLSAVIPTTGQVAPGAAGGTTLANAAVVVNGGGTLQVSAGGNIEGGLFEDDLGQASLHAGGAITSPGGNLFAPVLALANTNFAVAAGGDVSIGAVFNTTTLPESFANRTNVSSAGQGLNTYSYFFTYAPTSSIDLTSAGGSVNLVDALTGVVGNASAGTPLDSGVTATAFYAPTLNVAALTGNITLAGSGIELYPAATGNLSLLAEKAVMLQPTLMMVESDPTLQYGVTNPTLASTLDTATVSLPAVPLHTGDTNPVRVVAVTGDITQSGTAVITFPKAADFVAGGDITNLNYSGKNLTSSDVTLFEAGGQILYDTARDPATNQLVSNFSGIQVGGPGYVEALAGESINLGDGTGIVTQGRIGDPRLPAIGATLVVAAGLGHNADGTLRAPAYDTFVDAYLKPGTSGTPSAYAGDLVTYLAGLNPDNAGLDAAQALAQFMALPRTLQLPFLSQVLTDELNATGLAHTEQGTGYDRGYLAINTLFPQKDAHGNPLNYKGDIDLFFSQLKTAQGGDIDLLAPGGAVVVGVPNPPQELNDVKSQLNLKPPISAEANLGLLVLAQGAIQGFANQDFDVNQSRILTLQGGNIILWSSFGSIDAGKGAKTAQGAPPPVIETDPNGNIFVNPVGAVSGSGIGQLLTVPGIEPGLVDLIAPTGVVNAGEAGIRVAGNLNIAATAVLNVGNIKVGGTATGVPTSDAGALAGAVSGANALADAGKAVADQLNQSLSAGSNYQQLTESLQPAFIVVRLFCLGVQCQ